LFFTTHKAKAKPVISTLVCFDFLTSEKSTILNWSVLGADLEKTPMQIVSSFVQNFSQKKKSGEAIFHPKSTLENQSPIVNSLYSQSDSY